MGVGGVCLLLLVQLVWLIEKGNVWVGVKGFSIGVWESVSRISACGFKISNSLKHFSSFHVYIFLNFDFDFDFDFDWIHTHSA